MDYILSFAAVAVAFTAYTQHKHRKRHHHHHELLREMSDDERDQLSLLEKKWDYHAGLESFCRWMPKVELHVHFDGTWDPAMLFQYAKEHSLVHKLPQQSHLPWNDSYYPVKQLFLECESELDFHALCTCRNKRSLHEMLNCFEIFLPLVRGNLPLLEKLAHDFCKRQAQQHVVYTEMRYSPHLLAEGGSFDASTNGVRADPVVDAITRGLRQGCAEYGVQVNQILCGITWRPDWADDVVRLASERYNQGPCAVVGVDIAAGEEHFDEKNHPELYKAHKDAMLKAKSLGIPITLHAGETSHSVDTALEFGASRIGHGYRMSDETRETLASRDIHVEVCPTSSVETGGWQFTQKNWKEHPAVDMIRHDGLGVSLNSDDPSVFDTSLTWQWRIALGKMGLTQAELKETTRSAIQAAFLSPEKKEALLKQVEDHYETFALHRKRPELRHAFSDRVYGIYQTNMENC